ncbi:MAG: putative terminase large subunit [Prokaryotic dsDNA virus sp.]|nr:MAG: putative terminase large subunit [Prokaryotic dsDNA virus sp.]|tara:strand:- start:8097 stop:9290 length:1194 start_codon:yes stop_codon:yes gene_type:complete
MSEIKAHFSTSPVFEWNYNSKARVKINQGGTSSGKTYAILQVIFIKLIQKKKIATVIGQDLPNLKKGAITDLIDRILVNSAWMNNFVIRYNKSNNVLYFKNGSRLEFTSFKDSQDAHSGKRDIAFFNEANGMPWKIYEQVVMRTSEEVYIDYNPSEEFWVHEKLIGEPGVEVFYSNFSHNPYVHQNIVDYLFSLKEVDINTWNVYGLGKTGDITELVFEKVTIVDEMPTGLRSRGYGMDFGYRADPTTLIDCGLLNERDIYLDEIIHGYRMKTSEMDDKMVEKEVWRNRGIYADNSGVRIIDDLYDLNWKITGATKGPGSVKDGIDLLNDYNIHITRRSINIIKERTRYKHKVDKKTGKILNEPIDAWNHCWDAIRYWGMENLHPITKRKKGIRKGN